MRSRSHTGDLGVPKLVSKEPTVFEPFLISHTNKAPVEQKEETFEPFKVKTVNKDMLARPLFIPKSSDKELTEVGLTRSARGTPRPLPSLQCIQFTGLPNIHIGALSSVSNSCSRCISH